MRQLVVFKTKLTDLVIRKKVDKLNMIRFKYRKVLIIILLTRNYKNDTLF